jgi:ABC-type Mn2+/Zn2+ transport system ATPase subunit
VTPAVEFHDVRIGYHRGRPVLRGVDLAIASGELVGVIGPNGSGKSTLLRALLGLGVTVEGEIRVLGAPLGRVDLPRLGYVPQRPDIDPMFPVSALDVALMGRAGKLGLWRRLKPADAVVAREALAFVGMAAHAQRPFGQLSGGQQQRVLIARALAQEPDLLIFDEAFNGLDLESQHELIGLTLELHGAGRTVLFVMHNFNELVRHFDHIILVSGGGVRMDTPAAILTAETLQRVFYIDPSVVEGCLGRL